MGRRGTKEEAKVAKGEVAVNMTTKVGDVGRRSFTRLGWIREQEQGGASRSY